MILGKNEIEKMNQNSYTIHGAWIQERDFFATLAFKWKRGRWWGKIERKDKRKGESKRCDDDVIGKEDRWKESGGRNR